MFFVVVVFQQRASPDLESNHHSRALLPPSRDFFCVMSIVFLALFDFVYVIDLYRMLLGKIIAPSAILHVTTVRKHLPGR